MISKMWDDVIQLFLVGIVLYWVFSERSQFKESITALANASNTVLKALQARS